MWRVGGVAVLYSIDVHLPNPVGLLVLRFVVKRVEVVMALKHVAWSDEISRCCVQ